MLDELANRRNYHFWGTQGTRWWQRTVNRWMGNLGWYVHTIHSCLATPLEYACHKYVTLENCIITTVSSQPVACFCQFLPHYHLLYLLYRHHNRQNQIRPKFTAVRLILAILRFGVRPGRLDCKDACFHVPPNYAGSKTNSLDTMHVKQRIYRATDIAVCFFSDATRNFHSALIRATAWQVYRYLSGRIGSACAIKDFVNQRPNDSCESTGQKGHVAHMRRRHRPLPVLLWAFQQMNYWYNSSFGKNIHERLGVHRIKIPILYNCEAGRSDSQSVTQRRIKIVLIAKDCHHRWCF